MTPIRIALVTLVVAVAAVPRVASANDVRPASWGATYFSESDRDGQASGDALGLSVDPTGGIGAALGSAGVGVHAYRFNSAGRQVARFPVGSHSAAVAVDQ